MNQWFDLYRRAFATQQMLSVQGNGYHEKTLIGLTQTRVRSARSYRAMALAWAGFA